MTRTDPTPLRIEDAVNAHQRPKLEVYDDTQFLVLRTVQYIEHETMAKASEVVETGEIMVFAGPDFVLIVQVADMPAYHALAQHLVAHP